MSKPVVFLDLSYFVFHRFFAMQSWMKLSKRTFDDVPQMLEKYGSLFESSLVQFKKHFKFDLEDLIICKDCPQESVWRMEHFESYKQNRDDDKMDSSVFPYTYEVILPMLVKKYKVQIKEYPGAEADDVVAVLKNMLRRMQPDRKVLIITNDNDYLQLLDENTEIVNASKRYIKDRIPKEFQCCPKLFLEWKVIKGDKSDNIPAIAKRIGDKTATQLALNQDMLEKYLASDKDIRAQYEKNKLLIMFDELPKDIIKGIEDLGLGLYDGK